MQIGSEIKLVIGSGSVWKSRSGFGQRNIAPPKKGKMKKFHFEKFSVGMELLLDPECPL
jgi:hypothetical protein